MAIDHFAHGYTDFHEDVATTFARCDYARFIQTPSGHNFYVPCRKGTGDTAHTQLEWIVAVCNAALAKEAAVPAEMSDDIQW